MDGPLSPALKEQVDRFSPGWYVAISNDQIAGAAADFYELARMLQAQGKDPRTTLVVQSGVDYPNYVTIYV